MLHQVGVGALGPVFRTYEPTRDRLVAVKVFRLDITPEQAQSLADQLSVAAEAGLFHPSIVEPIAAGIEGTVAYRAEEYVAAESLDVAMRHYAPAAIDKVLPIITQLAGAIDFARTAGVGHGALHPRDIFVTPDEARATGFGVVEALERIGLRAPVRRPYSAPERVGGGSWSTPADVFSLAAITYELLTGRRPAGTGQQIGSLAGSGAGAHADALHAVLARAMDEQPDHRFQTALAFAAEIEAASRGDVAQVAAQTAPASAAAPVFAPSPEADAAPPADVEEAVAAMPPRVDVDERHQPVETEQEEAEFRSDEPEFDDILAERDEDEAHTRLIEHERAEQSDTDGRLLFDEDEGVEDLALDAVAREEVDRFADEFATVAADEGARYDFEPDEPGAAAPPVQEPAEEPAAFPATSSFAGYDAPPAAVHERSRPAMLPIAIAAVITLLVGFAAGWAVGNRAAPEGSPEGTSNAEPPPAQAAPSRQADPQGKAFSEEAVTPPSRPEEPPPPVQDPPARAEADRPAEPARPAQATGRLVVRSTPSRAGVTVDGEWRGRTPLTLTSLPFGTHEIRIVQPGYAVARQEVTLSPRTPQRTVSLTLRRSAPADQPGTSAADARPGSQSYTGTIVVDSRPQGARVLLDGKMVGVTPIRLPDVRIGSHVIRLQLEDHADWTTGVRVTAGRESRVSGSLERIR